MVESHRNSFFEVSVLDDIDICSSYMQCCRGEARQFIKSFWIKKILEPFGRATKAVLCRIKQINKSEMFEHIGWFVKKGSQVMMIFPGKGDALEVRNKKRKIEDK